MKEADKKYFNNRKPSKKPPFTHEMKVELKALFHTMSIEELAVYFNRTPNQVRNQSQRQYLSKKGN